MAYLNELHPEIFQAAPRPGGLANIIPRDAPQDTSKAIEKETSSISGKRSRGSKGKDDKSSLGTSMGTSRGTSLGGKSFLTSMASSVTRSSFYNMEPEKNCREYRIAQTLLTSQWMLPEEDEWDGDGSMPKFEAIHNVRLLLAIVISTTMLMAAGCKDIPKDHLVWTLSYLDCVKDEYGNRPPNVTGLSNQIRQEDPGIVTFIEAEEETEEGVADAETAPAQEGE